MNQDNKNQPREFSDKLNSRNEAARNFVKRNSARYVSLTKEWIKKNPEKKRAHARLQWAVRSGKIVKPEKCEKCKQTKSIEGHHPDYSKPLDVMWLCRKCHRQEHGTIAPSKSKNYAYGSRVATTKLTEDLVKEIRSLVGKMSDTEIALKYGVNRSLIYQIGKRKIWKHIV